MTTKLAALLKRARQEAIDSGRTDASMEDVAHAAGISKAGYAKLESGASKSTTRWQAIADHLGIPYDDVMDAMPWVNLAGGQSARPAGSGVRLTQRGDGSIVGNRAPVRAAPPLMPVLGHAAGGAGGHLIMGGPMEYRPTPTELENVPDGYLLRVSGESMVPRFFPNELLSIHPGRPYTRNDFVVVQFESGGETHGMVKQFVRWDDGTGDLVLSQYNPATEIRVPADTVKEVHRVVLPGL